MFLKYLVLLLCLGSIGCASGFAHKYSTMYDNALNTGDITIVTKNEDYQELKQRLSKYLNARGYTDVIFIDSKQGVMVVAKQGHVPPAEILLKYIGTPGTDNNRIDLVNGSDDPSLDSKVNHDIQEIADLIRNE